MQVRASRTLTACLGTALLFAGMAAHADIVANGGFETGDFTGWTQFGDTTFSGVDTFAPHSGTYAAFFGPVAAQGGISQTLTTQPGHFYSISFWLMTEGDANGNATPNSFAFNWNGGPAELTLVNNPVSAYTHYTFSLPATAATTDLRFTFQDVPAFFDLDDVSAAVPEPGSMALAGLGAALLAAFKRRRRQA